MAHAGLFAAADGDRLEEVLASMPLRVWRTDEVTPLSPHPNDPPPTPGAGQKAAEFLATFTLAIPPGTPDQTVQDTKAREAQAAHDLADQGHLLRLWARPGPGRTLGLYQARDAAQMEAILASLPLAPWMTVNTTPLSAARATAVRKEIFQSERAGVHRAGYPAPHDRASRSMRSRRKQWLAAWQVDLQYRRRNVNTPPRRPARSDSP